MSRIELELWYDSPALVFGSDQKVPEHRAPSIRGQLRYWARAIIGARTTDLQEVWRQESAAFGSTGAGSPIIVRVSEIYPHKNEIGERNVLPGNSRFTSECILESSPLTVWCYSRPAIPVNTLFEKSLTVWLLLGGIGKRSRRMFGSPGIDSVSGFNDSILAEILKSYDTPSDYTSAVKKALEYIVEPNNSLTRPPEFPTLHPKYSQVIIGKRGFGSAGKASLDLFRLFKSYNSHINVTGIFGKIHGGRRASPLIAQVRRIGDKYYPVLTYFYTDDLQGYCKVINNFMDEAKNLFSGEIVWGGAFK